MSFFKKLFGGGDQGNVKSPAPAGRNAASIKTAVFGRYTDRNKDASQLAQWSKALKSFENKAYVDSFESLMHYISDPALNNVTFNRTDEAVEFELIQGSKKVVGRGDADKFVALANIAKMEGQSIPVMRKLMGLNYGLKYSKFALKDGVLCMKFSSHTIDASPDKLYAGLKELAKKSDQQDDLLISEFSTLSEVDTDHVIAINEDRQAIKYDYLMEMINTTKAEVAKLDAEKMSGGIAFLLLDLTYQIDYLICPQGLLTDSLEKIQMEFFKKDNASTREKNDLILREFDQLMGQPREKILEGLYDVICTFGIPNPAKHKEVMDMMFKEREKVAWYRDNGYPRIVEAVYGYMVSYAFFNYGMVYPVTEVLNIAMHVLNPKYYKDMGDQNKFVSENKQLNSQAIVHALNGIVNGARKDFPYLHLETKGLRFGSPSDFIDSLILALDRVDLRKK